MYYLLDVIIENKIYSLDKTFSYFCCSEKPISKWIRVLVDFNGTKKVGYVLKSTEIKKEQLEKTPYVIKEIIKLIDDEPIIDNELFDLATYLSNRYVSPLVSSLQAILPPNLRPKSSSLDKKVGVFNKFVEYLKDDKDLLDKEKEILSEIKNKRFVLKSKLKPSILKKLLEKNCIRIIEIDKSFTNINSSFDLGFKLTKPQKEVFNNIINSNNKNILLKGVISSGKTMIYIKLIDYFLSKNRTVLYLVPEILFTDYLKEIFITRYKNIVGFITSSITDAKKSRIYQEILQQNIKIIVGTKSAVFAPLKNLGLVIIDEEFSRFFLNEEYLPYYDSVEVAQYRAERNEATFLIGSAIPSLKRYAMARKGIYKLIELNEPYFDNTTQVEIVSLKNLKNLLPGFSIFSKQLIARMSEVLKNKRQCMLIINKKGYSTLNYCKNCGELITCPKCGKSLIFYKPNLYYCNNCGYKVLNKDFSCKSCGHKEINNFGYGVDKIVEELQDIFKNSVISKVDLSNTNKVNETIINNFRDHKIDILVGTELLSKGHDFDKVDLICLLNIDDLLNSKSYLANEKTFDLIVQAAGRSGRNNFKEGVCIVQTFNSDNKLLKIASLSDYDLFYQYEMINRKKLKHPPFFYVSCFSLSSKNENNLKNTLDNLIKIIHNLKNIDENLIFYSKKISKTGINYLTEVIIKYKKQEEILKFCKKIVSSPEKYSFSTRVVFKPDVEYF